MICVKKKNRYKFIYIYFSLMINNLKNLSKYLSKNLDCNTLIDVFSILCIFNIQVVLRISQQRFDL